MTIESIKEKRIKYRIFKKNTVFNSPVINKNESYWFLLPLLELNKKVLIENYNLINTYLGNHLIDKEYENCLHLLFNTKGKHNANFNSYIDTVLSKHEFFLDSYETEGTADFGVVFFIDDEFKKVIELFKEGKYSEFPQHYVDTFFKKYNSKGELTHEYKVFTKHEDMRKYQEYKTGCQFTQEMEVWSKPTLEKEIYMYNENIETTW